MPLIPFKKKVHCFLRFALILFLFISAPPTAQAVITTPKEYHPVSDSYLRLKFFVLLNPVPWDLMREDSKQIINYLAQLSPEKAKGHEASLKKTFDEIDQLKPPVSKRQREQLANTVYMISSAAAGDCFLLALEQGQIDEAYGIWLGFGEDLRRFDEKLYKELEESWTAIKKNSNSKEDKVTTLTNFIRKNYKNEHRPESASMFLIPRHYGGKTIDGFLPPGSNTSVLSQRPRQLLNLEARGANTEESSLIKLGEMAFSSPYIVGEPSRSLSLTCNTCHSNGSANRDFFIPGLSNNPGSVDVTSNYFAQYTGNGYFNPVDIPDLRGIRFTAPYGRDGRFPSLKEFVRNAMLHEFNGYELDPILFDAIVAFMNELDFLPNPYLNSDGTLNDTASKSAKRGEEIFNRPYENMGGSCATCHIPSDFFIDRKRHDIGTREGSSKYSLDRALDTPTLLGTNFTAPYFHDGSQPTLESVVKWFNEKFELKLKKSEIKDLTAYLKTIGDGLEPYDTAPSYIETELKRYESFLSTFEYLKIKNKSEEMIVTLRTIGHNVDDLKEFLQDPTYVPIMKKMRDIMFKGAADVLNENPNAADVKIRQYLELYHANSEHLK